MRVLIADDEKSIRDTLITFLGLEQIQAVAVGNGIAAQDQLQSSRFDALLLDLRMPGMDGIELLEWLEDSGPQIPVIVISAHGDVHDAVTAMKRGAYDYLTKPFDPEDLVIRLRRAVDDDRMRRQIERSRNSVGEREDATGAIDETSLPGGISENPDMRALHTLVRRVAAGDATVLIRGESGTGKEVTARRIHELSKRHSGPFVPVNLAAVPEQLLESELFGYEKGAFTGASSRKPGLFETASGGTLFLDELGELPFHLQAKLLRVLQDHKLQRVGGTSAIPIDVRIISATNADLRTSIAEGRFREDLYYRINVIEIVVPPLRDRTEDLPALCATFLDHIRRRGGTRSDSISPDAIRLLSEYRFPGNIRELENIIERAALLADSRELTPEDFLFLEFSRDESVAPGAEEPSGNKRKRTVDGEVPSEGTLEEIEKRAIQRALYKYEGHRERTAAELGITRRTLLNKIQRYRLDSG